MSDRHDMARAMSWATQARNSKYHHNTIRAADRFLCKTALECETNRANEDPRKWAASWLKSVSSGHPEYPRYAAIADAWQSRIDQEGV